MDHNLNDESENIHNVDAFNDAINELNSDELATTNISDFEMEQGNSLSLEEYQGLIDQINDSGKAWLSLYPIHGMDTCRVCITNFLTTNQELDELISLLENHKIK